MAFETAGSVPTTQQTVGAIAKGGRIVITGMAAEETIPLDIIGLVCKEGKIFSQFRYKKPVSQRNKSDLPKSHQCKGCYIQYLFPG